MILKLRKSHPPLLQVIMLILLQLTCQGSAVQLPNSRLLLVFILYCKHLFPPTPCSTSDVEYGSENECQLPWEDKMVKAMQRDISAVLMSRLSSGLAASVRNAVGSTSVLSFVWVPLLSTRFRRGCCRRFMERHCSPFQFAMNALHLNIMLAEKTEEQGYSRGE